MKKWLNEHVPGHWATTRIASCISAARCSRAKSSRSTTCAATPARRWRCSRRGRPTAWRSPCSSSAWRASSGCRRISSRCATARTTARKAISSWCRTTWRWAMAPATTCASSTSARARMRPTGRILLIDDYRAIAMFYSNRGAEELRSGRYAEALDWLRSSVAIDPEYAGSWVNLGVALRRSGDVENAEVAYRPRSRSTCNRRRRCRIWPRCCTSRAMRTRRSTSWPWPIAPQPQSLHLPHARRPQHAPRPAGRAGRFYRKALKRQGENAESLAAMGLWSLEQGDPKEARNWLKRAEDLDKDAARVALLRRRLGSET